MGILVRFDKDGKAHPREFADICELHNALKDCLMKMAGPRADGKLSQLEYIAEKLSAIENGVGQGIMSPNGIVRQVRKVKVIYLDILRDMRYVRQALEKMDGGD